jgi:hypothetical protein
MRGTPTTVYPFAQHALEQPMQGTFFNMGLKRGTVHSPLGAYTEEGR